jgi:hypothetical protein
VRYKDVLKFFTEIITVNFVNHKQHINTLRGQTQSVSFCVNADGTNRNNRNFKMLPQSSHISLCVMVCVSTSFNLATLL